MRKQTARLNLKGLSLSHWRTRVYTYVRKKSTSNRPHKDLGGSSRRTW